MIKQAPKELILRMLWGIVQMVEAYVEIRELEGQDPFQLEDHQGPTCLKNL
jgi:hypothetical protein